MIFGQLVYVCMLFLDNLFIFTWLLRQFVDFHLIFRQLADFSHLIFKATNLSSCDFFFQIIYLFSHAISTFSLFSCHFQTICLFSHVIFLKDNQFIFTCDTLQVIYLFSHGHFSCVGHVVLFITWCSVFTHSLRA